MKYLEGLIYILIGICFMFIKVVNSIDLYAIYKSLEYDIMSFNVILGEGGFEFYTHSPVTLIIGILFIILGTIKIREVIISAK